MNTKKKAILALCLIATVMSLQSLTTALLAYIMNSYPEVSAVTIRSLVTIPSIVGMVVAFIVGPLSLKINKKYLLLFAAFCNLLFFAIFVIVKDKGPFMALYAGSSLSGVARGSAAALLSASVGEFYGPKNSAKYIAIVSAIMNLGAAVINMAGGAIGAANGGTAWYNAYWLGIVIIVPVIIAYFILMPKKPEESFDTAVETNEPSSDNADVQPTKGFLPAKVIIIVFVYSLLSLMLCTFTLNMSTYVITEYQLGTSVHTGTINTMWTLVGLGVGFSYGLWQKVFKDWLVPAGYAFIALGLFIMMTVTTTLAGIFVASFLIGFGFNITTPYTMAKVMELTPPRLGAVATSLVMVGNNLAMFFSAYILSFLSGLLGGGVHNTLLVGVIGSAIITVAAVFLFAPIKKTKASK